MIGFNGGLIGKDRPTSIISSLPGVWSGNEHVNAVRKGAWPLIDGIKYIRWSITARRGASDRIQASEFNLINNGANVNMSGATMSADPAGAAGSGSESITSLRDGNVNTKWLTVNPPTVRVIFEMPTFVKCDSYRWATANDTVLGDPVSWIVEVSNNGTDYYTIDTKTNFAVTESRQTYVGPFTFI